MDELRAFASSGPRVAHEVGAQGILGGTPRGRQTTYREYDGARGRTHRARERDRARGRTYRECEREHDRERGREDVALRGCRSTAPAAAPLGPAHNFVYSTPVARGLPVQRARQRRKRNNTRERP